MCSSSSRGVLKHDSIFPEHNLHRSQTRTSGRSDLERERRRGDRRERERERERERGGGGGVHEGGGRRDAKLAPMMSRLL